MKITASKQEENIEKATEQMIKSLNCFGQDETLKLLVNFSNQDSILGELLAIFPSIVTMNHFLFGKPIIKFRMTNRGLERFLDTKFPFLVKEENEREDDRNNHRKASKTSKKIRRQKRKIQKDQGLE